MKERKWNKTCSRPDYLHMETDFEYQPPRFLKMAKEATLFLPLPSFSGLDCITLSNGKFQASLISDHTQCLDKTSSLKLMYMCI